MGSRIWLGATLIALSLALPGCDSSDDPSTPSDDQSTPSDDQSTPSDTVAAPEVGTCWRVPADTNWDVASENWDVASDWFDESPSVPCTEAHTTETVRVVELTEPTIAEAKDRISQCWEAIRLYLGVDFYSWIPAGGGAFLPSREQIADGASWMRCDATFPATWDFAPATSDFAGPLRTTVDPALGIADNPPAYLWACLDEHPNKPKQPFVPCDQPHQYEQTGVLALIDDLSHYPPAAELAATAKQECANDLQGGTDDVAFTARWHPRSAGESTSIAGACFMFNKNGEPLPPRQ